ncbi:Hypothetical_protein [Hexamita inflata]|uniref:Hypothetical_protein n=1 Tax=Hexamita inflata TaxID=28002 RepID=A0AA86QYQ3_9EUKA|nr:Hypothetical protein HINF_LOCUS54163 [Hexamita inflata]
MSITSTKSQHTYSQYSFGSTSSQWRLNSLACASTSIVMLHTLAQVPLDTVLDQLDVSLVCFGFTSGIYMIKYIYYNCELIVFIKILRFDVQINILQKNLILHNLELNHPPLFEYRHLISFQKWPGCLQVRANLAQFGLFLVSDLVFHFGYRHLFQKYSENFIKFLVS